MRENLELYIYHGNDTYETIGSIPKYLCILIE